MNKSKYQKHIFNLCFTGCIQPGDKVKERGKVTIYTIYIDSVIHIIIIIIIIIIITTTTITITTTFINVGCLCTLSTQSFKMYSQCKECFLKIRKESL